MMVTPSHGRKERLEVPHLGDPAVMTEIPAIPPQAPLAVPLLGPVIATVETITMATAGMTEVAAARVVLLPGSNSSPLQDMANPMLHTEAMLDMLDMVALATELRLPWLLPEHHKPNLVLMRPLGSPALTR